MQIKPYLIQYQAYTHNSPCKTFATAIGFMGFTTPI